MGHNKEDKKCEMEVSMMLCQFTVKNYKSIRDEMTFDMQAAAISEHEDKVIEDKDGEQFLPVSAIYGPNGGDNSGNVEDNSSLIFNLENTPFKSIFSSRSKRADLLPVSNFTRSRRS